MTTGLLLSLIGLALLDSVNVSTIWVVVAILLLARTPLRTGWAFAVGAIITFTTFTVLLYLGTGMAEQLIADLTVWIRRVLFGVLALFFVYLGLRRLRTRQRREFRLPRILNAWTALPLGLTATIADIPNSFPMFFAVERLASHDIGPRAGVLILLGYCLIQALPTLTILVLAHLHGEQLRHRLTDLFNRYAVGEVKASRRIAGLYFLAALASLGILVFVIG